MVTGTGTDAPTRVVKGGSSRLGRDERREKLLDVATSMVGALGVEAVTMDAVAERAGVSRPLVYKHFADRSSLLQAVYARESLLVHKELAAAVVAAASVEDMFRALISGALRAQAERGAAFAALRSAGLRTPERRDEQRRRDRTTLRHFVERVELEFGIDAMVANTGVGLLLGMVEVVLAQWQRRPTPAHARLLEDTYLELVTGALQRLAASAAGLMAGPAR